MSKRPSIVGGEMQVIEVPGSEALVAYTADLAQRAELVRSRKVDPADDNMLKITSDGRKASLFNGPPEAGLPAGVRTKVDALVEQVWALYRDAHDDRATQLVFCDLYTPKGAGAKARAAKRTDEDDEGGPGSGEGVTLTEDERGLTEGIYGEVKRRLVAAGMLASQVEYIHDATSDDKKTALYARVNDGKCRVLIGSTTKMGTGLNVQRRILGIHHLTAPWRPDWLEQANGRGRRQGNMWDEIHIYAYVTQRSYDSCIWQMLEQKSRLISQIAAGTFAGRVVEDIGDMVLTASMAKAIALGNPAVLDKIKLETELAQEEKRYRSWAEQQARTRYDIARLPRYIAETEASAEEMRALIESTRGDAPTFACTLREIGGDRLIDFTDLGAADQHVATLANLAQRTTQREILIGAYRSLRLTLRRAWGGWEMVATHSGGASLAATVRISGTFAGLEREISSAVGKLANTESNLNTTRRRLEALKATSTGAWSGRDRVATLLQSYRAACEAVAQDGIVDARRFSFGDLHV